MKVRTYVEPGADLHPWEYVLWALSRYVSQPLHAFCWRAKITPALRERCVDYALRAGANDPWKVERDADQLATYIAKGKS